MYITTNIATHEVHMKLLWKCNCGAPPDGDRSGMSSLFLCTICRPDQARVGLGELRQVLGNVSIDLIGLCMFSTLLGNASTDKLRAPTPLPRPCCIRIILRFCERERERESEKKDRLYDIIISIQLILILQ